MNNVKSNLALASARLLVLLKPKAEAEICPKEFIAGEPTVTIRPGQINEPRMVTMLAILNVNVSSTIRSCAVFL